MSRIHLKFGPNTRVLLRSTFALIFVFFLLLKPLRAYVLNFSEDQIEFNYGDTDGNESDESESDDKESEKEDNENEDHVAVVSIKDFHSSIQKNYNTSLKFCPHEHDLGVLLPPPEVK